MKACILSEKHSVEWYIPLAWMRESCSEEGKEKMYAKKDYKAYFWCIFQKEKKKLLFFSKIEFNRMRNFVCIFISVWMFSSRQTFVLRQKISHPCYIAVLMFNVNKTVNVLTLIQKLKAELISVLKRLFFYFSSRQSVTHARLVLQM